MAPVLHCVRHAQGIHNLGSQYHGVRDPKLTATGEEQCLALKSQHFQDQSHLSLIAASPLSRTLQTAYTVFKPALVKGSNILAIPDAQEVSALICDTGLDIVDLAKRCDEDHWPVDLHLLHDGWNTKTSGSRYSPSSEAIEARARDARQLIRQKFRELFAAGNPSPQIVLVTHGGFLHYFTGDWESANKFTGTGWENCETRAYTYDLGIDHDDVDARLSETMVSRRNRGLDYPMYPPSKQQELFRKTILDWEIQALQNASALNMPLEQDSTLPLVRTNSKSIEVEI